MRRMLLAAASIAALTAGAFAQDAVTDQNPAAAGKGAPNTQGTMGNENQAESVPATGSGSSTGMAAETMNNGGSGVDQNSPAISENGAPNAQGTTGNENQAEAAPATGTAPASGMAAETMNNGGAGVDQNSPTVSENGAPNAQGTTGNENQAEAAPATTSETTGAVADGDEPAEGNYSDAVKKDDTQK